ncbi:hypothetical protein EKH77_02895 [Streptomyces luteoverticillatus]|uniref:Head-tail adaptor protein n=1 Tax=Streptomyces luteoverticillatus TaxID=66425 RepID=A0A3Q9FWI4_STRLT|nr:hypothetical protein [Streptomyces luteoverticillatus]AZQ70302.1 hypothetical protein EKH77_02895 [Streptomyces luteoverticillatus]
MIFDRRVPVELRVYPPAETDDGYGGTAPGLGRPATIRAFVQPLDAPEGVATGWAAPVRRKVITGPCEAVQTWARVEMDGELWHVVDPPRVHGASRRTRYVSAVIEGGSGGVREAQHP